MILPIAATCNTTAYRVIGMALCEISAKHADATALLLSLNESRRSHTGAKNESQGHERLHNAPYPALSNEPYSLFIVLIS